MAFPFIVLMKRLKRTVQSNLCALRGHLAPLGQRKSVFKDSWSVKWGSIDVKFSMAWQEKGDLLIQVTA